MRIPTPPRSWEEGVYWPEGSFDEARASFRKRLPKGWPEVTDRQFRTFLALHFPKAHEKFTATEAAITAMGGA